MRRMRWRGSSESIEVRVRWEGGSISATSERQEFAHQLTVSTGEVKSIISPFFTLARAVALFFCASGSSSSMAASSPWESSITASELFPNPWRRAPGPVGTMTSKPSGLVRKKWWTPATACHLIANPGGRNMLKSMTSSGRCPRSIVTLSTKVIVSKLARPDQW